ncbi:nicotinate (nicotinamide) nucleotide adenylyltransferase [Haploplasma axanthum]|nr:nicotinate (nicotinamide) nucleotide adenylyltransferase [Haploplasma axanthum]
MINIVYGGSFNPPTKAHYEIVKKLLNEFRDSKVIIVPVGDTYFKKELIDFKIRKEMLKIVFNTNPNVEINDIEYYKPFDGTLKTLLSLEQVYENLHLVIGADNLVNFDKWINYEEILKKYPLIIIKRNKQDVNELIKKYLYLKPKYQVIEFNNEANSTAIRNNVHEHKDWLDRNVYQYIKDNELYGA